MSVADDLLLLAQAEQRLDATVAAMSDADVAAPSPLPGWTRGHVLAHLARNAEGNARMVAAKLRGEDRPQYPGGPAERAAAIDEGASRPAAELLADLRAAVAELAAAFAAVGADEWELVVLAGVGPRSIRQRVGSRRVEVEVHHADLGLAYGWRDWPADLVTDQLPRWARALDSRPAGEAARGDWLIATPERAWTVSVRDDGVGVLDAADAEPAGSVRGDAAAVYAWLIGRADPGDAGLVVEGDERVADLPRWFPWS